MSLFQKFYREPQRWEKVPVVKMQKPKKENGMNTLVKLLLGKEVALAIKLLQAAYLVFDSIRDGKGPNVAPFARQAFKYLPDDFKAPQGPATEQEFIDAVYNVFALFTKSKK